MTDELRVELEAFRKSMADTYMPSDEHTINVSEETTRLLLRVYDSLAERIAAVEAREDDTPGQPSALPDMDLGEWTNRCRYRIRSGVVQYELNDDGVWSESTQYSHDDDLQAWVAAKVAEHRAAPQPSAPSPDPTVDQDLIDGLRGFVETLKAGGEIKATQIRVADGTVSSEDVVLIPAAQQPAASEPSESDRELAIKTLEAFHSAPAVGYSPNYNHSGWSIAEIDAVAGVLSALRSEIATLTTRAQRAAPANGPRCRECGDPAIVGNVCYDHAKADPISGEPIDPSPAAPQPTASEQCELRLIIAARDAERKVMRDENQESTLRAEDAEHEAAMLAGEVLELRESVAAKDAEIAKEKASRVKWQGLAYDGMKVVDRVIGGQVLKGTGTCVDTFKADCEKVNAKIMQMNAELDAKDAKLTKDRDSYRSEFEHALACVDRVFQNMTKQPALLPDFLRPGTSKFDGVVKLAEAYIEAQAERDIALIHEREHRTIALEMQAERDAAKAEIATLQKRHNLLGREQKRILDERGFVGHKYDDEVAAHAETRRLEGLVKACEEEVCQTPSTDECPNSVCTAVRKALAAAKSDAPVVNDSLTTDVPSVEPVSIAGLQHQIGRLTDRINRQLAHINKLQEKCGAKSRRIAELEAETTGAWKERADASEAKIVRCHEILSKAGIPMESAICLGIDKRIEALIARLPTREKCEAALREYWEITNPDISIDATAAIECFGRHLGIDQQSAKEAE